MSRYDLARAAARHADPYADPATLEAALVRLERAGERRRRLRASAAAVVVVAAAIVAALWPARERAIAPPRVQPAVTPMMLAPERAPVETAPLVEEPPAVPPSEPVRRRVKRAPLRAVETAPSVLGAEPPPAVEPPVIAAPPDPVDALLRQADEARRAHRLEAAVTLLRRAADLRDARRPMVLFTLGKVLLELGRFEPSALAFTEAASSDPHGLLVEDSLARAIEAWARAGKLDLARGQARSYLDRYPRGLFRESVQRWTR